MKSEKLIAKKVNHHFSTTEKQVLFDVKSLHVNYDGLLIHESDIIYLEEGDSKIGYVKEGDVNMDDAVSKEVAEDLVSKTIYQGGMENPFKWKDGIVDSEAVLKIEVTAETLKDNPELVAEGIVLGEIITVDASDTIEEIIPAKVAKKKRTKKQ